MKKALALFVVILLCALTHLPTLAQMTMTVEDTTYSNVVFTTISSDQACFRHATGAVCLPMEKLPEVVQLDLKFLYPHPEPSPTPPPLVANPDDGFRTWDDPTYGSFSTGNNAVNEPYRDIRFEERWRRERERRRQEQEHKLPEQPHAEQPLPSHQAQALPLQRETPAVQPSHQTQAPPAPPQPHPTPQATPQPASHPQPPPSTNKKSQGQ